MSTNLGAQGTLRERLHEAALWHVTGLLFRRPDPARGRELVPLAVETGDAELIAAASAAGPTSEGLYHAWLGAGGPLSPREVSYRPIEDPGRILAEIAAYHRAFAYRAAAEDPHDHVAVAADFVAYLNFKEAYALAAARHDDADTTRAACARFVERHVRPVARGMARRLLKVDDGVNTAHFCAAVGLLCRLAGVGADLGGPDAESADAPFLLPGLDGDELDCGAIDGACPRNP